MLRQRKSPRKGQRKVVRKDQLQCWRSLHNWVVYLKILIRENLFYVKKEFWDQNTPSNSPKAPGTKLKIGKERVHREELSKSVHLMSAALARQNSRKDHMRRPCTKKDAPAEQHGIWRNKFTSSRIRQGYVLYSHRSKGDADTYFKKDQRRDFVVDSGASTHMMAKKNQAQRDRTRCEGPETLLWYSLPKEKCIQTRRHKSSFTI